MYKFLMKSKLLREELKFWSLIVALTLWALVTSIMALRNTAKTLLIGIDDAGTRVIAESSDRLLQSELKNFLKEFLNHYLNYDEKSYLTEMSFATDLMSEGLYSAKKEEILNLQEKLQKTPLTQKLEIENIDLVESETKGPEHGGLGLARNGKVEAIVALHIQTRLSQQKVKLKVQLQFQRAERTTKNPWGFIITEITDAVL